MTDEEMRNLGYGPVLRWAMHVMNRLTAWAMTVVAIGFFVLVVSAVIGSCAAVLDGGEKRSGHLPEDDCLQITRYDAC